MTEKEEPPFTDIVPSAAVIRSIAQRPPSDSPYLSGKTAKSIIDSDASDTYVLEGIDQSIPSQNKKAEEVVSDIPLRIKRLLYDIALLYRTGYLDDLNDNWKHLTSIHNIKNKFREFYDGIPETNNQSDEFDTGFNMGLAFSTLTGDVFDDDRGSEFLLGFLRAYFVNHSKNEFNWGTENSSKTPKRFDLGYWRDSLSPMYNITPSPILFSFVNTHVLEEDNITIHKFIHRTQEFIEKELGTFFGKCIHLRLQVEKEKTSLDEASVPGMEVETALEALWELKFDKDASTSRANSKNIAQQAGKKSKYKGQVSHVLNRLSTQGKNSSNNSAATISNSMNKDIVYYESGEWHFTNYGLIFGHYALSEHFDTDRIQDCGFISDMGMSPEDILPQFRTDVGSLEKGEPLEPVEEVEETDTRGGPLADTRGGSDVTRGDPLRHPSIKQEELDLVKDAVDDYFS